MKSLATGNEPSTGYFRYENRLFKRGYKKFRGYKKNSSK